MLLRSDCTHRCSTDPDPDHVTANVAEHAVDHVTDTADQDHVIVTEDRAADHVTSTDVVRAVEAARAHAPLMVATGVIAGNLSSDRNLRVCTYMEIRVSPHAGSFRQLLIG